VPQAVPSRPEIPLSADAALVRLLPGELATEDVAPAGAEAAENAVDVPVLIDVPDNPGADVGAAS